MNIETLGIDSTSTNSIEKSRHFLAILFMVRKAHAEFAGHEVAKLRAKQVLTREHARVYVEELMPEILKIRNLRRTISKQTHLKIK